MRAQPLQFDGRQIELTASIGLTQRLPGDDSRSLLARTVGETGEALATIVDKVGRIDGLILEIAQSSREQATGLSEVNTAVNQMDQVTQQNAAMVEEATAASHSLTQEAQGLAQLIERFRLSDDLSTSSSPVHQAQARVLAFARS